MQKYLKIANVIDKYDLPSLEELTWAEYFIYLAWLVNHRKFQPEFIQVQNEIRKRWRVNEMDWSLLTDFVDQWKIELDLNPALAQKRIFIKARKRPKLTWRQAWEILDVTIRGLSVQVIEPPRKFIKKCYGSIYESTYHIPIVNYGIPIVNYDNSQH